MTQTLESMTDRVSSSSLGVWVGEQRAQRVEAIELDIIDRVNAFRSEHNLPPLLHHPELSEVARAHSRDMGERGYYAHVDPDGVTPNQRIVRKFVPRFVMAGTAENIAYRREFGNHGGSQLSSSLAREFMEGWINSPGHRANMLHDQMTLIGVGVYATDDTVFATQKFMDYIVEVIEPAPGADINQDGPQVRMRVNRRRVSPERFVVKVNLPDHRARWEVSARSFYTGFGFLTAEWTDDDEVLVALPVDRFGPGRYSLQFGDRGGNATYQQQAEFLAK